MKTRTVFALAAALVLGAPAAAHAATVPVQQLSGDFAASNNSVTKTPEGVHFGVYADAGVTGGTLIYNGANGLTLGQLTALGYTYNYTTSADVAPIAAPYLRIFLDADGDGQVDDDVIFDPSLCGTATPAEDEDHAVDVTTQTVRFDNDGCDPTLPPPSTLQTPWPAVQAAHAAETIVGILVTQGFSGGQNASAQVRNLTVNGTTFAFNVPPIGPTTTVIQRVPVPAGARPAGTAVAGVQQRACRGATVRRIHAPRRRGERFLRVNAALQTRNGLRSLKANGRTVTVDLRNRPEANYNVRLISRYRTKSGKIRRVVTRRNLSVACS